MKELKKFYLLIRWLILAEHNEDLLTTNNTANSRVYESTQSQFKSLVGIAALVRQLVQKSGELKAILFNHCTIYTVRRLFMKQLFSCILFEMRADSSSNIQESPASVFYLTYTMFGLLKQIVASTNNMRMKRGR